MVYVRRTLVLDYTITAMMTQGMIYLYHKGALIRSGVDEINENKCKT